MKNIKELRDTHTGKKIEETGRKGIFYVIFGRTGIILLLLLLQIGVLFLAFSRLTGYLTYAYWGFTVMSVIAVVCVVNRKGNPEYKLAWMVPITIFPVLGVLLYVFVELNVDKRILDRRMQRLGSTMRSFNEPDSAVMENLKEENEQVAKLASYVYRYGGYPAFQNTAAQYFPMGKDKFQALVEELQKAEQFIFMEYFIVNEGHMWGTIHEILRQKAKEGVEVRVMYDGTNTVTRLSHTYPKELKAEGIQCRVFNQIRPALSSIQNNRDHRKIVVIDGKTAFTGGINLADEYIGEKERFGVWKDTAAMIQGDAVRSFTWMFLQMWNIREKKDDYEKYLNVKTEVLQNAQNGYVIPYGDSPLDEEPVGELVYMDILNTAKDYVHIMTPYLIIDHDMLTALTYAAKRGVDVRIIMPGIPDKQYAFTLAKTYYPELLQAGVRIYQYTEGFVHAKEFTSDGDKGVIGTINLDYRSLFLHFECAAYFYKMPIIGEMEADFQATLAKCTEVTLETCRKEKWSTKLAGKLFRLIAPLM